MKILLVSTQIFTVPPPGYGGLEMVVYDLAHELGDMGHDVYVLAPEGSGGDNFRVITPVAADFSNPEALAHEAIKPSLADFDIIHEHGWGGYSYLPKREGKNLRILQTLHGPLQFGSKPVDFPNFVAASQAHADFLKKEVDFDCRVIPHGIDLSNYPFHGEKKDYLLFLARVMQEKGALEFVRFCMEENRKGFVAGGDLYVSSQDYVRRVMKACEETGGLVEYLGEVPHDYKLELLQEAACLVTPLIPPYIEVFGLSTIEALATGTPVLSTNRGAAKEIIIDGTGAVVESVANLAEGLAIALQCNPDDCRARAEEYPRRLMAERHVGLYSAVLHGAKW